MQLLDCHVDSLCYHILIIWLSIGARLHES
nr:MAG TPA_asm: hypothetical protein [Caudoviricetes sp.]